MFRFQELKNNQHLHENLRKRDLFMRALRGWFYNQGFIEVETPRLVRLPGMEPYLDPFHTMLRNEAGASFDAHLITSPEYTMKKLLAAGFTKIFDVGKVFRNHEPFGDTHNSEFTMIEWYRVGATYIDLMDDLEKLITYIIEATDATQTKRLKSKNLEVDISLPWERLSVKDAFKKYCDLNLDVFLDLESIRAAAMSRGYKIDDSFRYEDIFFKIFLNEIEPHLGTDRPVFLYDYPVQLGALARKKSEDPRYVERVELYLGGLELANGFSELVDPREQRKRLEEEQAIRTALHREVYPIDEEFIAALGEMRESAGIALGVDRLIMLLLDASSIDEVLCFPVASLFN